MAAKFISHRNTDKQALIALLERGKELYYVTDCYNQIHSVEELNEAIELKRHIKELDTRKWVTMTDKFMSGWGPAQGKINKLVLECDNMEEAEIVYDNACKRSEMKHVNIRTTEPTYNSSTHYTSWHDKTDYSNWYSTWFKIGASVE